MADTQPFTWYTAPLYSSRIGYLSLQNRPQSVVSQDEAQASAANVAVAPTPVMVSAPGPSPARGPWTQAIPMMTPHSPAMATVAQDTVGMVTAPVNPAPQGPAQPAPLIPTTVLNFVRKYPPLVA